MSEAELLRLRAEVVELRELVLALSARVAALEASEGFELVRKPATAPPLPQAFRAGPRASGSPGVASRSSPASEAASQDPLAEGRDPHRVSVAKEVGAFLGRACRGEHRGNSGRDKVQIASRVYIVLAPFSGELYPEPRLYSKFESVKALCKRGPDAGRSVFVELPTQWEALIALKEAGYDWPEAGMNGN